MSEDVIRIDFSGSTPNQSGGVADYIPPGVYAFEVTKGEVTDTNDKQKKMVSMTYRVIEGNYPGATYAGKRVRDNFTMPRVGTDDSSFGLDRLHGLIKATTDTQIGEAIDFRPANLVSRKFVGEVSDNQYENRRTKKTITTSQVQSYWSVGSVEAQELLAAEVARANAAPASLAGAGQPLAATPAAPTAPAQETISAPPPNATPAADEGPATELSESLTAAFNLS